MLAVKCAREEEALKTDAAVNIADTMLSNLWYQAAVVPFAFSLSEIAATS